MAMRRRFRYRLSKGRYVLRFVLGVILLLVGIAERYPAWLWPPISHPEALMELVVNLFVAATVLLFILPIDMFIKQQLPLTFILLIFILSYI